LDALWADLASSDAAKAHRAVWSLAAAPGQSLPLLQRRLPPAAPPDPKRVERLLGDLDSDQFAVREKAARELEEIGDLAGPLLRKALAGEPPPEVRRRVKALLESLESPVRSPECLRALRAVQVLESVGNEEARRLLKALAEGTPEARLTQEAKASLERLARRPLAAP
jgi:hypothetical protein